ncbi:MAG: hypothetical protein PWQ49_973 [Methanohalophilus sp.]|nr:hypothetical protein [Methanohalophilus sp.]
MQTKLRTYEIIPNKNICFPIGTILAVNRLYDILDLSNVFGKHKKNDVDINKLLKSSKNLTVPVDFMKNQDKKYIYANFYAINMLILRQTWDFHGN